MAGFFGKLFGSRHFASGYFGARAKAPLPVAVPRGGIRRWVPLRVFALQLAAESFGKSDDYASIRIEAPRGEIAEIGQDFEDLLLMMD